jgi:ATP-binding cassette subfamily C protein
MNTLQADIQKYLGQESALWSILNITRKAEEEKEVHTKGHSITFETPQDIRLKNIGLCFGEKEIFTGLNFTFPKNQITLLKGESGKGKTSVIDIICGLLQPTQGEVKVSGTPLAQIDIYQWRRQIGYVDQFPFLFKGSVRENIVQDGPTFENDEHLNNCLTLSHLDDFVASLEDGLNFMLEEGGNNISGGQRQRIALARALYFRPNYLILDEPTSALDPSSQEMIFNSMTALKKQMTVIAISHSTEIEPYADSVLDMGEISRT